MIHNILAAANRTGFLAIAMARFMLVVRGTRGEGPLVLSSAQTRAEVVTRMSCLPARARGKRLKAAANLCHAGLVMCLSLGTSARAQIWNSNADFSVISNSATDRWQYGYQFGFGGSFTLDDHIDSLIAAPFVGWNTAGADPSRCVFYNTADTQATSGTGAVLPARSMAMHPGPGSGEYTVTRWVAPATDSYSIDAVFTGSDLQGTSSDVSVRRNNDDLGFNNLPITGLGSMRHYSATIVLSAGDTISFLVGRGANNSYINDNTRLDATIVRCTPSVATPPASTAACPTGSRDISVAFTGIGPFTYQWQLQTALNTWTILGPDPLPLPCGGSASAYATPANSPTVTIGIRPCPASPTAPQRFQIRCLVTNACGSVTSNEATYTTCPADFNCSGSISVQDIFDFLAAYFSGNAAVGDFNQSGAISVQDIFDFLAAYFAGCD